LKAIPGFRLNAAFGPTNEGGGCTVIVGDNKEAADAIARSNREAIESSTLKSPDPANVTTIEGEGVKLIRAVPA
jgi:hypothetical protein